MGESSGAQTAGPPSTDSLDSLICAVAEAPPRVPPESGAYASPFAEGVEVGRYRLLHKLGRGGMGSVWEAAHRVTGKRVALKIVREGVALTPQLKRRFEQEARLVTAVGHPGVVEVHDIFEAPGGWPVLVMDVLSGETLGSWLARGRRSLAETASLLAEVVAIVSAAHRAGVVHRDLKPENIFICHPSHGSSRVRVLDFGIARLVKEPAVASAEPLTETGTLLGTPQYMAPEQLLGERGVDERADVWALGVILYECLVGRRPIAGDNIGQVVHNLNEDGVPELDPSEFPDAVVRAVRAMLERDRRKRAADLAPVESVLRRAAHGELGPPRIWARLISKPFRASSIVLGATALCGVALSRWATEHSVRPVSAEAGLAAAAHPPVAVIQELNVATIVAKSSTTGRVLDVWQRSLSARLAGKFAFGVRFPGSTGLRGGERSVVSRLRTGQVDGAMLSSRALPSISASVAAMELPGVVDSWAKVDWLRGQLRDKLQAGFALEGYHLLSWHDEGCQRIMSRGRPVRRVVDLAHRRIAASDTDPFSNVLFSLVPGAVPVPIAESDVSASLRDGSRLGVSAVVATAGEAERAGWIGSLEHVTMIPVACTSGAVVLGKHAYERLPEEIRATVDDVSARAEEAAAPHARKEDTAASLRLARTLTPIDPTAAERRDWQRLFASAASRFTQSGVPQSLAEQAISLGKEIDALR